VEDTIKAGKKLALSGTKIDVIIASPLGRTKKTAEVIAKEI
jgi:broad specificity phosphatase PhoE